MPVAEFGGTTYTSTFSFSATLDLANHTAVASVDTDVTSALVKSGDLVIAVPPTALEAGIGVQGCHSAGSTFTLSSGEAPTREATGVGAGFHDPIRSPSHSNLPVLGGKAGRLGGGAWPDWIVRRGQATGVRCQGWSVRTRSGQVTVVRCQG
jgi:hypothetical protein